MTTEVRKSVNKSEKSGTDGKETKAPSLTKRARRMLGSNPSTTWQQQPNIKSPAARAKAYLIDAGLYKAKSSKSMDTTKSNLDPELDLINSPEIKFGRLLASPDQRTRHSTVRKLSAYLKARSDIQNPTGGLSELDLLKLWKGMWHTLYLCDKVPVQTELSKNLSELMWSLGGTAEEDEYAGQVYLDFNGGDDGGPDFGEGNEGVGGYTTKFNALDNLEEDEDGDVMEEIENTLEEESEDMQNEQESLDTKEEDGNETPTDSEEGEDDFDDGNSSLVKHCRGAHLVSLYIRTFFRTVRREWANMDKYRVDKFYTILRQVMSQMYKYMAARHWNLGIIRLFNDTMYEEVLAHTPNGIRYHLIDIAIEEVAKVNKDSSLPLTEATLLDCLEPFFALAQLAEEQIVHDRVMEKIFTNFLDEFSIVSQNYDVKANQADITVDEIEKKELIMDQVHVGTVAKFIFELASDTETQDRYRSDLYDMHKLYVRRIKEMKRDVILDDDETNKEVDDHVDVIGNEEEETDDIEVEHDYTIRNEINQDEEVIKNQTNDNTKNKKKKKKKKASKNKIKDNISKKHEEVLEPEPKSVAESANQYEVEKVALQSVKEESLLLKCDSNIKNNDKDRKKDKKYDEKSKNLISGESNDTITITVNEQKKAVEAAKKLKKKNKKSKEANKDKFNSPIPRLKSPKLTEISSEKRVKFGKVNMCKSHSASMRDLRRVDLKEMREKTPEKGILLSNKKKRKIELNDGGDLNRKKSSTQGKKSKGLPRKKTTDYF